MTRDGVDTTLYEMLKEHPEEILGGDTTFPLLPGNLIPEKEHD